MNILTTKTRQAGATLITALVMLIVLTLLTFSAIRSSMANLRIAGNAQVGAEAAAAAQQTIEQVISSNFTSNPVAVTAVVGAYTVSVPTPACTGSTPVLSASLDYYNPDDRQCFPPGTDPNPNLIDRIGQNGQRQNQLATQPYCFSQRWDVQANVNDPATGAVEETHQGIALRVGLGVACN